MSVVHVDNSRARFKDLRDAALEQVSEIQKRSMETVRATIVAYGIAQQSSLTLGLQAANAFNALATHVNATHDFVKFQNTFDAVWPHIDTVYFHHFKTKQPAKSYH